MRPAALILITAGTFALILAGALELIEQRKSEPPAVGVTGERYLRGIERMWYGQ